MRGKKQPRRRRPQGDGWFAHDGPAMPGQGPAGVELDPSTLPPDQPDGGGCASLNLGPNDEPEATVTEDPTP